MNIDKLLLDRVLIEATTEEKTKGGFIVEKNNENKPEEYRKGIVTHVGTGKFVNNDTQTSIDVVVGDTVIFQYPSEITIEGKSYLLVKSEDIILILK